MTTYHPKYKPNQLLCGKGSIAITTGWTVREQVAKHFTSKDYAVIGNLYSSTRGISYLIRNILYNPNITYLLILSATKEDRNAGSCQALRDFFLNGVEEKILESGRAVWQIISSRIGYIDKEIPLDDLNTIRRKVKFFYFENIAELKNMVNKINSNAVIPKPWGIPKVFPEIKIQSNIIPSNRYGHRIEGKTIAEAWPKILHRIRKTGIIRPTGYDGNWQEVIDLMTVVTDEPSELHFPVPNYLPVCRTYMTDYIPQILEDATYREGVKYTYGQRLRSWFGKDQIAQVITKLINEIDAASAVMSLWDADDHEKGGSPCLNHIWVRIIEDELSLTATFRSNDMFGAWPANAMGLRKLQTHIRKEVMKGIKKTLVDGPLITISQSAHIYDDSWEVVDRVIDNHYFKQLRKAPLEDDCGNFIIEILGVSISVTHTDNVGEFINQYQGKSPLRLIRDIAYNIPNIKPVHLGYLGVELEKAANSIRTNTVYTQDR